MQQQNQEQSTNEKFNEQQKQQQTHNSQQENKIAQNPNPRANENIKHTPFDKEQGEGTVGTEITDGEAG